MKPMLASREFPNLAGLRYPLYASPKLDGVRALVVKGKVLSRKLEVFPNDAAQRFAGLEGLDGELIVGKATDPQVRNITSGTLNRKTDVADGLEFHAFDLWNRGKESFERAVADLDYVRRNARAPGLVIVEHTLVRNGIELLTFENDCLEMGYEGVILRAPDGPYKFGRSTLKEGWMMKLKRFVDAEAQALRVNEEMENTNKAEKDNLGRTKRSKAQAGLVGKGRAGELEVRVLNGQFAGVECVVPLGAAGDKGKAWWWAHRGDDRLPIITFKYFPKGTKDKPLLPIYVGVREGWDRT